jgi:hypothetical protein
MLKHFLEAKSLHSVKEATATHENQTYSNIKPRTHPGRSFKRGNWCFHPETVATL